MIELHSANPDASDGDDDVRQSETTVIGLILFAIYTAFYAGFVLLNTFAPKIMELMPIAGVNLAILYGFSLIIVALVLAGIYGWMCRKR